MNKQDIISLLPANPYDKIGGALLWSGFEHCKHKTISALSKITDKESEYRVALEKIEADVSWGDHHDRAEYESQLRKIWDIASKALKVTKEECI